MKALGLCSAQFCGTVKSALLPPLSPNLADPKPPSVSDGAGGQIQLSATIAAGEFIGLFLTILEQRRFVSQIFVIMDANFFVVLFAFYLFFIRGHFTLLMVFVETAF